MRAALSELYLPFAVTIVVEPGAHQASLAKALPFVEPMTMRDGRATAYVCRNFTCQEPVTTVDADAGETFQQAYSAGDKSKWAPSQESAPGAGDAGRFALFLQICG